MVERAKSGHPGLPLGAAPMAYVLWSRHLKHNPADPNWWDRDRFVLSAGHGSALLYSLLHLTGYDLPMDELRRFRQLGSRTPGHPEFGHTPGVEATTGPLGQGFANGIGFALAQHYLGSRFNRPGFALVDHWTYGLCSDGDLMEGIASEAASFAGSLKVGKLIYLYDDNHISLEGPTSLTFTEDVGRRFESYGWAVSHVDEGNDLDAIDTAIRTARKEPDHPHLIRVRTHIGYGSPKQDTKEAHGEPLGPAATKATKEKLGWPTEPEFLIPEEVRTHFRQALETGSRRQGEWTELLRQYRAEFPDLAREFERMMRRELPVDWARGLPSFRPDPPTMATRDASTQLMQEVARRLPELIGGSADLAPSTRTLLEGDGDFSFGPQWGRNLHYGVREHAMTAIVSGMALHGGILPYGATFLIFSDYARPALRLSALMGIHTITVFTHDSIGLGEDGPTHEPVEQLAGLRAIPGYTVLRPADANEVTEAWRSAVSRKGPVAIVLTRQKVPVLDPTKYPVATGAPRGAYVLAEAAGGAARVILIGTGSEVQLCLAAQALLASRKIPARVVSMPSWELFEEQTDSYRESVVTPGVPKVAVEAASPMGWERYVGTEGAVVGLRRFGASGPGAAVLASLGFTPENVVAAALSVLHLPREGAAP
ncbi:MAG: transketolase [Thermoplasmata archaeon]|nr:transketolase [Thermoplasmata archaeon]MCI4359491.1 transketolase [Thermoplasmata archaeon]